MQAAYQNWGMGGTCLLTFSAWLNLLTQMMSQKIDRSGDMKFNIGDRVVYTAQDPKRDGKLATVISNDGVHLIEFDDMVGAHDGNGRCKEFHGWFCSPEALRFSDANVEPRLCYTREW